MGDRKLIYVDGLDVIDEEQLVCSKCGGRFDKTNPGFWFLIGFLVAIAACVWILL
jgi:hypothetical protein